MHIVLKDIPDFINWESAKSWFKRSEELKILLAEKDVFSLETLFLEWNEIKQNKDPRFGYYPSDVWRKFALAVFFADLISYDNPVDQVSFQRILFILHAFPEGFRLLFVRLKDQWWPVGYTGWYPMLESTFEIFEKKADQLKDRMVIPYISLSRPYLYFFNMSVISSLKKTPLSKNLMRKFSDEVSSINANGYACITVSEDGKRVADRFGMSCKGFLNLEGSLEGIYTIRF